MGQCYEQLRLAERIEIYRLHEDGKSLRAIASILGRAPSSICRELKRNSVKTKVWPGGYKPDRADELALRRRTWDCRYKLARQPHLRAFVRDRLAMGWSPEQIAGRLALSNAPMRISHESIYRFIYFRTAQKDYWHRLLPKKKLRRGKLGKRGGSPVARITQRRPIHDRAPEIETRATPGHWEADLMAFSKFGKVVLVAHERQSRLLLARRRPNKKAQGIANALRQMLAPLPEPLRASITFDNGTEFAFHHKLKKRIGIKTFFCDPHAPWQKGGVENAILRMRRALPRKSDLAKISQADLDNMIRNYNNTPRKCLGYKTPAEVFINQLQSLHFNCESTFPPARE